MWTLSRLLDNAERSGDTVSTSFSWNAFNETFCEKGTTSNTIGYGPFFSQPPTSTGVCQASLDYLVALANEMGQITTVVTADQAIYDILKGITCKDPHKYQAILLRLGGFHNAQI